MLCKRDLLNLMAIQGLLRQDALPHLNIKAVIAPTMPIIPVPSQNKKTKMKKFSCKWDHLLEPLKLPPVN